jgi:hypothetical protein
VWTVRVLDEAGDEWGDEMRSDYENGSEIEYRALKGQLAICGR